MRPVLKAGLLPVWRDRDTVQIGIDPRRAVALTGLGDAAGVLRLLDGSRDREQVIAAAQEQGIPRPVTERVLTLLAAGGVLDDYPAAVMRTLSRDQRGRLAAELASAALAAGHSDAGAAALARRDAARVRIHGEGRVAAAIADILTTSGVGRVSVAADPRPPGAATGQRSGGQPAGAATGQRSGGQPAGASGGEAQRPPDAGRARGPARRPAAEARTPLPDLAILVGYPALAGNLAVAGSAGRDLPDRLMAAGVAHLAVRAEEAIGVVGPLVRPGRTACLRCVDRTRAGLDPAWPLILAQLAGRAADPAACDAALAAAVAAQAAAQSLAFLDRTYDGRDAGRDAGHPAENGTLELVLPGWQWRRRTWPRHPDCACGGRDDPAR